MMPIPLPISRRFLRPVIPLLLALCQCAGRTSAPPKVDMPPPRPDTVAIVNGKKVVIKSGRVLSDLTKDPYRVRVPERFNKAGSVHKGVYKVCVTADGKVRSVTTLKSSGNAEVDDSFRQTIQVWQYQPYQIGDKPVPFCYPLNLKVTANS